MDNSKLRDFCFAADENYSMPLTVCVASLLWSMRKDFAPIHIHVLDLGIGDDAWAGMVEKWKAMLSRIKVGADAARFNRIKIDKHRFDGFMLWNGSVATYARLLLPDLLPDVEWCLYSDGDVLFVESPLALGEYCGDESVAIAGHKNPPWCDAIDREWFVSHGLPFEGNMHLCAGFLLMNLALFRRKGLSAKAFEFLGKYENTPSADQSALNHVCIDCRRRLPNRWGVFCGELSASMGDGGAIHYADGVPWKPPKNCTMLMGKNPAVAKIWRRFAEDAVGVNKAESTPGFRAMANVRIRSLIIRGMMLAARIFHFKINDWYTNWPGKHIDKAAVDMYTRLLFD